MYGATYREVRVQFYVVVADSGLTLSNEVLQSVF